MKAPKIHKPRWITQLQINALIGLIILGILAWRLMTLLDHVIRNGADGEIILQLIAILAATVWGIVRCAEKFASTNEIPEDKHDHISDVNPGRIGTADEDPR